MKKGIGLLLLISGALSITMSIIFKIKKVAAVSIIGGADGPTSIFVAGKLGGNVIAAGIIIGIVLLAAGIFVIRKKSW